MQTKITKEGEHKKKQTQNYDDIQCDRDYQADSNRQDKIYTTEKIQTTSLKEK